MGEILISEKTFNMVTICRMFNVTPEMVIVAEDAGLFPRATQFLRAAVPIGYRTYTVAAVEAWISKHPDGWPVPQLQVQKPSALTPIEETVKGSWIAARVGLNFEQWTRLVAGGGGPARVVNPFSGFITDFYKKTTAERWIAAHPRGSRFPQLTEDECATAAANSKPPAPKLTFESFKAILREGGANI